MAMYTYEAIREPGNTVRGELEAENEWAAASVLTRRGYHVLSLEDASSSVRGLRLGLFGGVKRRDVVRFTRQLAGLLRAGLPLSGALRTLREQANIPLWASLIGGLHAHLEEGHTFADALAACPEAFDSVYVSLVRAGEEGGTLVEVLDRIAHLVEQREELLGRVRLALVYPGALLTLGCVTVFVMMTFVVPMFTVVFQDTGQALPMPTRVLIAISAALTTWWWIVIPGAIVGLLTLLRISRTQWGREQIGAVGLRMPIFGPMLRLAEVTSFAQTMSTLLQSGIPIVQALAITAATQRNAPYQAAVQELGATIREGETLSAALKRAPLFPPNVASVTAVGEHSGELPNSLRLLAEEINRDLDRQVKVGMTLLEPLLILVLGGVVGFIVLAMLLPIFNLGDTIRL